MDDKDKKEEERKEEGDGEEYDNFKVRVENEGNIRDRTVLDEVFRQIQEIREGRVPDRTIIVVDGKEIPVQVFP